MDGNMRELILIILIIAVCLCAGAALFVWRREKRTAERIQEMLDNASAGKLPGERLDESRISAIENSMWRYLQGREAVLERMKREKEQIQRQISDISHQAVIPLANITLYSQLLEERLEQRKYTEDQEIREEMAAIRDQAAELDFLMEGLGKLSRLEGGIIHIQAQRQLIGPVLEMVKRQFEPRAGEKEIGLSLHAGQETAWFDEKWTVEAISNIVDNAVKYTPSGGKVEISVEALTSLLRVDIRDTGRGIPEEEQARIFSRFYRAGESARMPGVGIGLYIAREVMQAQNGYIRVSSKPGEGSVFSLYFLR